MAEMLSRYPRSSSRSLGPARQHVAYTSSEPWEDQRSVDSQSINNEDMADIVGRLAVECACARAHKLLGKIHVEVTLEEPRQIAEFGIARREERLRQRGGLGRMSLGEEEVESWV